MVNLRKSMLRTFAALLVTLLLAAGGVQIAGAQDSNGNITIDEGNDKQSQDQDADQENEGENNNAQSQSQGNSDEADNDNDTEQGNKVVLVEDIGSDETETGVVLVEDIGSDETETGVEDNNNVAVSDGGIIGALIALLLSILAP